MIQKGLCHAYHCTRRTEEHCQELRENRDELESLQSSTNKSIKNTHDIEVIQNCQLFEEEIDRSHTITFGFGLELSRMHLSNSPSLSGIKIQD